MSSTANALRDLYSESKLVQLDRVSAELKANPKALDTHSRDVRASKQENESGKA